MTDCMRVTKGVMKANRIVSYLYPHITNYKLDPAFFAPLYVS